MQALLDLFQALAVAAVQHGEIAVRLVASETACRVTDLYTHHHQKHRDQVQVAENAEQTVQPRAHGMATGRGVQSCPGACGSSRRRGEVVEGGQHADDLAAVVAELAVVGVGLSGLDGGRGL